jgi:hypothetical protein
VPGGRNRHRKLLGTTWREVKRSPRCRRCRRTAGGRVYGGGIAVVVKQRERMRRGKGKGTKSIRTERKRNHDRTTNWRRLSLVGQRRWHRRHDDSDRIYIHSLYENTKISFGSHYLGLESRNLFMILKINIFSCHKIDYEIYLENPWFFTLCPSLISFGTLLFLWNCQMKWYH